MKQQIERVRAAVDAIYDEVVALRRHIHMHPELSNEERETMAFVSDYLTRLGIPHETHVGGYGIVAHIGDPKADFAIAIRADMDALPIQEKNDLPYASVVPGVMHACGHDIHTAVLMGTARVLKDMEGELKGAIKLFFQPAEEKGGGGRRMIEDGCMEHPPVRRALGFHVDPALPAGKILFFPGQSSASSNSIHIKVHGSASHGSRPDLGVDAILAAGHVLVALQNVVSRQTSPLKPVVVTIGTIQGGTKNNIVAGEVEMTGTLRVLDLETRDEVKERIRATAEAAAAVCGATAEVEVRDGYPPLVNDKDTVMMLAQVADKAFGSDSYSFRYEPSLGGEDFSYFSNMVPSAYFRLGVQGEDTGHPQLLHNEWLCPAEDAMKNGILLEVLGALALLEEETK